MSLESFLQSVMYAYYLFMWNLLLIFFYFKIKLLQITLSTDIIKEEKRYRKVSGITCACATDLAVISAHIYPTTTSTIWIIQPKQNENSLELIDVQLSLQFSPNYQLLYVCV